MSRHEPPLVVHVIYALSTGGLENGLVNIINRTPPDRYRHAIVCITDSDEFASRITADNVEVYQLHKKEGRDWGFYLRIWRLFRELRPDIIHSRNLAALETQLFSIGLPHVRRVHGEHGRESSDLDGSNLKYLFFRRVLRLLIDRYIAVSRDLACWLEVSVGVPRGKVVQIYNGVDQERFQPSRSSAGDLLPASWSGGQNYLTVGTVGRLDRVKDQASLISAVAILREQEPELGHRLRLVIVGDGPLRRELAEQLRQCDMESVSWLAGDRRDVAELLEQFDVFVLPSLAEGVSNTLLEAMASGLPVVATAVGGNTEIVDDGRNGVLVPASDPVRLAQALKPLLESYADRQALGQGARERVCQSFDWDRAVDAYLNVYDQLLQPALGAKMSGVS